jgi:hypothetical protein
VGLFSLPSPRVAGLVARAERADVLPGAPLGAVVAYGRNFVGRGAHTVNVIPPRMDDLDLTPVDVASWGATLLSRAVFDAGVRPDPDWFFGLEDFDFFWRVGLAGFRVLVDGGSARAVAEQQTTIGRDVALRHRRPTDGDEAWRAYYHARNSVMFARRHGHPSWYLWHLAYSARHVQLAGTSAERSAILRGLWDGARGRTGEHVGFTRAVGEFPSPGPTPGAV